jgi:hypothetical protein
VNLDRLRVTGTLNRWRTHDDLLGVRDPSALARPPEKEQPAWQKLWSEVAAVLGQARATR